LREEDRELALGMFAMARFAVGWGVSVFHGTQHVELSAAILTKVFVDWHKVPFLSSLSFIILISSHSPVNDEYHEID
jgi:hypothetical protein